MSNSFADSVSDAVPSGDAAGCTANLAADSSCTLDDDAARRLAPPARVAALIDAYRMHGYRAARFDPLDLLAAPTVAELGASFHGLDPDASYQAPRGGRFAGARTVAQLQQQLDALYRGAIGLDCSGVRDTARRNWLFARREACTSSAPLTAAARLQLLRRLLAAQMWEHHAATRCPDAKRFSLEGCESLIPLLDTLVDETARCGVPQMFIATPHRGRLNVLVNLMDVPADQLVARLDPASALSAAQRDLPYHSGGTTTKRTAHGDVRISLAHNPSHLQSVYPVVSGMARAYNDEHPDARCVPVVIHGDAAFAGQGIVMETLNMTRKAGYALGGTIHVIVNNQIGFTTHNAIDVAGHVYCTDIARAVDAPVIHVNADQPEAVLEAARLAFDFRQMFGSDIVVDLVGYRRLGHSEHDEPSLTQPFRQAAIDCRAPLTELYYTQIHAQIHTQIGASASLDTLRAEALAALAVPAARVPRASAGSTAHAIVTGDDSAIAPPAVTTARLRALTRVLTRVPPGVICHPIVDRLIAKWQDTISDDRGDSGPVDWCMAENLAYASLLDEGHSIRLSGLDVARGTFMHRHAIWHAQDCLSGANNEYMPLAHIAPGRGFVDIVNSPLTEEAVLGFEYGYSAQTSTRLTLWEAQYGDFVNGAQVIVDHYVASGEYKWGYRSRLVVMLPHGHEGVGPEHSNGHLGRFLQLCADNNLRVVVPATSAQWFHLLRDQATAPEPKPLIVMAPKSAMYRTARSHSPLREFSERTFAPLSTDARVQNPAAVTRAVLCSGKLIGELVAASERAGQTHVAIVPVQQLYPFPSTALKDVLATFANLTQVVWAQEEDANQGAWRTIRDDLEAGVPAHCRLSHVVRVATPSGAHSSLAAHEHEQQRIVRTALGLQ